MSKTEKEMIEDLYLDYDKEDIAYTKGTVNILDINRHMIGGTHYIDMSIQPFEIIEKNGLNFFEGSALKYLLRYKYKNGIEDLEKCKHYIDKLIELYPERIE